MLSTPTNMYLMGVAVASRRIKRGDQLELNIDRIQQTKTIDELRCIAKKIAGLLADIATQFQYIKKYTPTD